MITLHAMRNVDGDKLYAYDFKGLSTDEKPTFWGGKVIEANSMFLEEDTGDFYYVESQGSKGEKETLVPQMSFTGSLVEGTDFYVYRIEGTVFFNDKVTVIFDGQKYDMAFNITEEGDEYKVGVYGEYGESGPSFDNYPFAIDVKDLYGDKSTNILVQDDNEHTIEVSGENSISAVWKKVGSGGGEPVIEPEDSL